MPRDARDQQLRRDQILDVFEELWNRVPGPDLLAFFQEQCIDLRHPNEDEHGVITEVLHIDLERRFRAGMEAFNEPLVLSYVRQFPALSASAVMELVVEESRLRARLKLAVFNTDELVSRLPLLSAEQAHMLREQLASAQLDTSPAITDSSRIKPGDFVGKYRIVRRLGEGGMGVVFEAEQDQSVRRRVAIKIIKPKLVSGEMLKRFDAERQALAMMDHEHIARVFDAGITDDGIPFFVMELVQGRPISEFCDQQRLSLHERLALFVQTCDAIQHAHQKGIVHRDIKPSNVLVSQKDSGPHVKVIDFGVAKAIQPELRLIAETLQTGLGRLIGTLQYMSPEQAEGNPDIDVRTDVYSLGVLLYELLTGSTPIDRHALQNAAIGQVLSAIQKDDPPRPSSRLSSFGAKASAVSDLRRTDVKRLNSELKGDLDWIAMKALEKDRSRRYGSAVQFAEDVQRYLQGQAVIARPPSFPHRLQKTMRRHRVTISTLVGVFMVLLFAVTVTTWQMIRANVEANRANQELGLRIKAENQAQLEKQVAIEQSQLSLSIMTAVIREQSALRNVAGTGPARRRILDVALNGHLKISGRHAGETLVNRSTMHGLMELGDVVMQFGTDSVGQSGLDETLQQSALNLARDLFRQAHEIALKLSKQATDRTEASRDLAATLLKLGSAEQGSGEIKAAEAHYEEALRLAETILKESPSTIEHRNFETEALRRLGDIKLHQGETEKAKGFYARQLKASAEGLSQASSIQAFRENAVALEREGRIALEKYQFDKSVEHYRAMIRIRRQLLMKNPLGTLERRDLAVGLDLLSDALLQKEEPAEAANACLEALTMFRELRHENRGQQAESDLANCLIANSHVRRVQIRLTEAEALASEAKDIYVALEAQDTENTSYQRNHALSLRVLSTIQMLRGDWESAAKTLTQSQALRRQRFEKTPTDAEAARDYMAGQLDLGMFHLKKQDFTAADRELQAGFDALQSLIDDGQLIEECRANQEIFQWYLDGCAMGPIAVGNWQQILLQPKEKLPHLLAIRCELLVSQRRTQEIAESARYLLQLVSIEPDFLNDAATALANCGMLESGWNGKESFPPESGLPQMTDEQEAKSISFAKEALAALRQAQAAGFTGLADNWTNPAFWALRKYPEFLSLCGSSPTLLTTNHLPF